VERKHLATLTNYGQYLDRFPPEDIVEIFDNTSWSCVHGVERWRSDCGCQTGGKHGWHQRWRKPLRAALDWLRDHLARLFEDEGQQLLSDPWAARDGYITLLLDRSPANIERFFQQYALRRLSDAEVVQALKLLEMQRHALLMYTSCAWFFAELSGIETLQMLACAARAIQLAREVAGLELEASFLDRLAEAPSNLPQRTANGRDVYLALVKPMVATLRTVIADYAISALIEPEALHPALGVYEIQEVGAHRDSRGSFTLATGRVRVQSRLTGESLQAIYAAVAGDGHDFRCSVKGYVDIEEYAQLRDQLFQLFARESVTEVVRALDAAFGEDYFALNHLFPDEQRRIGQLLLAHTMEHFGRQCAEVFRANQQLIAFARMKHLPLPAPLRVAAEASLNAEVRRTACQLQRGHASPTEVEKFIRAYQEEAKRLGCTLDFDPLRRAFEAIIEHHIGLLPQDAGHAQIPRQALEVVQALKLDLNLWRVQNLFWRYLTGETRTVDLPVMLELGTRLGFNQSMLRKLLHADASPVTRVDP
jgi:hypothetical protein